MILKVFSNLSDSMTNLDPTGAVFPSEKAMVENSSLTSSVARHRWLSWKEACLEQLPSALAFQFTLNLQLLSAAPLS